MSKLTDSAHVERDRLQPGKRAARAGRHHAAGQQHDRVRALRRDARSVPAAAVRDRNFNLGSSGRSISRRACSSSRPRRRDERHLDGQAELNDRSRIALDDDSTLSNANLNDGGVAPYPAPGLSATNTLRVGCAGQSRRRLHAAADRHPRRSLRRLPDSADRTGDLFECARTRARIPPPIVAAIGGRFHVASANVLNFFTTLGGRGAQTRPGTGEPANEDHRRADRS